MTPPSIIGSVTSPQESCRLCYRRRYTRGLDGDGESKYEVGGYHRTFISPYDETVVGVFSDQSPLTKIHSTPVILSLLFFLYF